jgi:hypothetical protein
MDKQIYINRNQCIDIAIDRYKHCIGPRIFDCRWQYRSCKSQFQVDLQKCKSEYYKDKSIYMDGRF